MPTFNKDNELIYDPEVEGAVLPNQVKVLRPKKYKAKMTTKRKWNIKRKLIKLTIVLIVLVTAITYGAYKTNEFFKNNELQFRLPVQMPVQIVPRRHEVTEQGEPSGIIKEVQAGVINFDGANFITKDSDTKPKDEVQVSEIVYKVFRLESSAGQNDSCRKSGTYNGYGFIPGTCYKTQAEVQQLVTNWFSKKLKTHDLPTALCGYNLGFQSKHLNECINQSSNYSYYKDYLTL